MSTRIKRQTSAKITHHCQWAVQGWSSRLRISISSLVCTKYLLLDELRSILIWYCRAVMDFSGCLHAWPVLVLSLMPFLLWKL